MLRQHIVIRGRASIICRHLNLNPSRGQSTHRDDRGQPASGKKSLRPCLTLSMRADSDVTSSRCELCAAVPGADAQARCDSITGIAPSIRFSRSREPEPEPAEHRRHDHEIYESASFLRACGRGFAALRSAPLRHSPDQICRKRARLPEGRMFQFSPRHPAAEGGVRDLFEAAVEARFSAGPRGWADRAPDGNLQLDRQMRHTIDVVGRSAQAGPRGRGGRRLAEAWRMRSGFRGSVLSPRTLAARECRSRLRRRAEKPKRRKAGARLCCPIPNAILTRRPPSESRSALQHALCVHALRVSVTSRRAAAVPSFNSPQGMCVDCQGLGMRHDFERARHPFVDVAAASAPDCPQLAPANSTAPCSKRERLVRDQQPRSKSCRIPSPWQSTHIPCGLLKLKSCGLGGS